MVGLFQETGPCEVVEVAQGQLGTKPRDWGWDRSSNIIYIDQPAQVGFSYDVTSNGSLNLITNQIQVPPGILPSNQPPSTFLNGTFASNNQNQTANTTEIAAHAAWHMLQGFLGVFPRYNPALYGNGSHNSSNPVSVGVNLFAESYGGKYGPAFAALWEEQNSLRRNGTLSSNKTFEIRLSSLGILQGCIDDLVQGIYYPRFADNNTYAISALPLVDEETAANSFLSVGGCQELIQNCRNAVQISDPQNEGNVQLVNQACTDAVKSCQNTVIGPFMASGRDPYDITQKLPDPFPPSTYLEYLNQADVQASIGARVNFTQSNDAVSSAFQSTGDLERGDSIDQMAYLLSLGIHVALIYGDRDYLCNWRGGEAISFSIAAQTPAYAPFYAAGYADIVVNDTYVGGAVRQYGNLSFSRIYDAGHLIPAYQPETMFTVFTRIISGSDISLGHPADLSTYKSNGTANATYTSKAPPQQKPICWVRDVQAKCTDDQKAKLLAGEGVIINGVLYDDEDDWKSPDASLSTVAGWPGHAPSPTAVTAAASQPSNSGGGTKSPHTVPTGVFTATATPSPRKSTASGLRTSAIAWLLWLLLAFILVLYVP